MPVGEWRRNDALCQWELGEQSGDKWRVYGGITDETLYRFPRYPASYRKQLILHYRRRFGTLPPPMQELADAIPPEPPKPKRRRKTK